MNVSLLQIGALLITNAEDSIKRNGFDVVFKAEIFPGDSNGVSRLKQSDILIQADCSDMLAAFHFYRDELAFQRDHKVNLFGAFIISPEIWFKSGSDKLRIHMIFRRFLAEVSQRGNSTLAKLNLIENDKCIASGNGLSADKPAGDLCQNDHLPKAVGAG